MLVMPDVEEPFVPLGSDGLFVDPYESKTVITSLLRRLPDLFTQIKVPEPAVLPTLDSALAALSITGGKIICSLSSLPSWGPGALFRRDDGKLHGIETEKKLFQTDNAGWKKTASKMVESGVGVDFFIASPSGAYMDIATVGEYIENTYLKRDADKPRRSCICSNWRRDLFLPKFCHTAGSDEADAGIEAHPHPSHWLPGTDEGSMFKWSTGLILSRKLPTAHLRRRP